MVKVGDKTRYLGIELEVVSIDSGSVHLRRANAKRGVDFIAMVGSDRYYALFPKCKNHKNTLFETFTSTDLKKQRIIKHNCIFISENSPILQFIKHFSSDKLDLSTATQMVKDNEVWQYALLTYAYSGEQVKFKDRDLALFIANKQCERPMNYTPKIMQFYLNSLQDQKSPNRKEYYELAKLIPLIDTGAMICAFCGSIYKKHKLAITPSKAKSLLKELAIC